MRISKQFDWPLVILLSGCSLQWVEVGPVPVSQIMFIMAPVFWFMGDKKLPVGHDVLLFKVFAAFVGVQCIGILGTENLSEGVKSIARNVIYGGLSYLFYAYMRSIPLEKCLYTLRNAIFITFPVFLIFFLYSANNAGVNILASLQQVASTGNPNVIQRQIFAMTLNNGVMDEDGLSSAARHGIMISLMTIAHVHMFTRVEKSRVGTILSCLTYFLVFFSMSRASVLSFILAAICFTMFLVFTKKFSFVKLFFATGIMMIFALTFDSGIVGDVLQEKFVGDVAQNPRVYEYIGIVGKINEKVLLGWGVGTPQNIAGLDAYYPHNFLTYSWHQIGILGLFIALIFFLLVVYHIVMGVIMAIRHDAYDPARSSAYLVSSALFCIILVRLLFAKGGLLAVPEWTTLVIAAYFARIGVMGLASSEALVAKPSRRLRFKLSIRGAQGGHRGMTP